MNLKSITSHNTFADGKYLFCVCEIVCTDRFIAVGFDFSCEITVMMRANNSIYALITKRKRDDALIVPYNNDGGSKPPPYI